MAEEDFDWADCIDHECNSLGGGNGCTDGRDMLCNLRPHQTGSHRSKQNPHVQWDGDYRDRIRGYSLATARNQPLKAEVKDGRIVFSVGLDTLVCAAANCEDFITRDPNTGAVTNRLKVNDVEEFARDAVRAAQDETEDGASLLTDFIDAAMYKAIEDGATSVDTGE